MKQITITKVGYNTPSQANWSYGIWLVSFIDTSKSYNISHTVKENFGGDTRFCNVILENTKHKVIEVKGIYTSTGTPKITGVAKMQEMESNDFVNKCIAFLKNK